MTGAARPVVLTNVLELSGNPYLRLWNQAVRDAGADVCELDRAAVLRRRHPRWIHLQWPERALRDPHPRTAGRALLRLLTLVGIGRARGARVLLTMHNVHSHDSRHPRLDAWLWRILPWLVTDLHLLCGAGGGEVVEAHPRLGRARRHVIPHGNYGPVVGAPPGRREAREAEGLPASARVLVTFGRLRAYKGTEALVGAFRAVPGGEETLVVTGEATEPSLRRTLESDAARDGRLRLDLRRRDDDELARLVRAADAVVLPYRRILNSGSALMALTLGRPVLLPRTPTFAALAQRVGPGWVGLYDGELTAEDLRTFLDARAVEGEPDLEWCDWSRVSAGIARLLRSP